MDCITQLTTCTDIAVLVIHGDRHERWRTNPVRARGSPAARRHSRRFSVHPSGKVCFSNCNLILRFGLIIMLFFFSAATHYHAHYHTSAQLPLGAAENMRSLCEMDKIWTQRWRYRCLKLWMGSTDTSDTWMGTWSESIHKGWLHMVMFSISRVKACQNTEHHPKRAFWGSQLLFNFRSSLVTITCENLLRFCNWVRS